MHLFKYLYLYLVKKNHYHIKRETVKESDTMKLNLKVRLVEPKSTCSKRNNVGHSLRYHTGMKETRKCFQENVLVK